MSCPALHQCSFEFLRGGLFIEEFNDVVINIFFNKFRRISIQQFDIFSCKQVRQEHRIFIKVIISFSVPRFQCNSRSFWKSRKQRYYFTPEIPQFKWPEMNGISRYPIISTKQNEGGCINQV